MNIISAGHRLKKISKALKNDNVIPKNSGQRWCHIFVIFAFTDLHDRIQMDKLYTVS